MWKKAKLSLLNDEPEPRLGPGLSRPFPSQAVREYTVMVQPPQGRPMKVILMAPSMGHAVKYAKNRWPAALVEAATKKPEAA